MPITSDAVEKKLKDIEVSDYNVRRTEPDDIDELAESIKKYGLLQPVVLVGKVSDPPPYRLIVGQRRFKAHQKLGLEKIRAVFCDEKDEWQLRMLSLSENMHRKNLNYSDAAEAITHLYKHFAGDYAKVAHELGLSEATIRDYVKIEEQATPRAKDMLKKKEISRSDVKVAIAAGQGDPDRIDAILDEVKTLTRYDKGRLVEYSKRNPGSTVRKMVAEAKKPKYQPTVILNLGAETDKALNTAVDKMSMNREEIAVLALEDWLREKGFLPAPPQGTLK